LRGQAGRLRGAAHHATCNSDLAGATHLASLDTAAEITELKGAVIARAVTPITNHYVGVVQQRDQADLTAGWLVFGGGPLPAMMWSAGQPNDDPAPESNDENLGALNLADLLNDTTGDVSYPAICECDGVPIAPTVAGLIP